MANPFVHLDLTCSDPVAAKKFYLKVFDWKIKDYPEMNWSGIDVGKGVGGGLGKKQSPKEPTAWTAYVEVDSVKKSVAKAQKAGAKVVLPFMEIPGMGAMGIFIDPQGAQIGVWEAAKKAAKKKAASKKKPAAKAKKRS